jgi:SAM-dependent methyltransferase
VGWKDQKTQNLRFEKLSTVFADAPDGFSVNDLGCGYGAFFSFLESNKTAMLTRYFGYDISEKMITEAKRNIECQKAQWFLTSTLKTQADYSIVSGTFNVRFEHSNKEWKKFIENQLLRMYECSKKGFAFNLLSSYVDWEEPHLYYGDPLYFFDFCKTNFSGGVCLLHDYPLYEWTICVKYEKE